jgi:ubiquinone/menaquinone biosynthesis C-methylase UbiE
MSKEEIPFDEGPTHFLGKTDGSVHESPVSPEEMLDEEYYNEYMKDLGLHPEDITGHVLDIGAGDARFARYVEMHGLSKEVISLDTQEKFLYNKHVVVGNVDSMPFNDGEFDLVISHASVPHVYYLELDEEHPEELEKKLQKVLREMIRVVKPGGQVRFGPIDEGKSFEIFATFRKILDETLDEIQKTRDASITTIPLGEVEYVEDRKDNESYVIMTKAMNKKERMS